MLWDLIEVILLGTGTCLALKKLWEGQPDKRALVLAIPIMLIPLALIWYINIGGIYLAMKEAKERRATR